MYLLIMGPPGAGKGTQALLIKQAYHIPHISTGEMFREAISNNTPLGLKAKEIISYGNLAPDDITIQLVTEKLHSIDYKKGFLLDGFPRTLFQAQKLDEILKELSIKIDAVINIVVDQDVLIDRIVGRRTCKNCQAAYHVKTLKPKIEGVCDICGSELIQRKDDTYATVLNRFKIYDEETKPIIEYYKKQNLIKNVNGEESIEMIFENIKNLLGGIK